MLVPLKPGIIIVKASRIPIKIKVKWLIGIFNFIEFKNIIIDNKNTKYIMYVFLNLILITYLKLLPKINPIKENTK